MAMPEDYVRFELPDPERVEIRDAKNYRLALFTKHAYTVTLAGPERTFAELTVSATHSKWIRTYPAPFKGIVDFDWLSAALDANEAEVPDIIAIAMQYISGAPALFDADLQIAGDASYGPLVGGKRQEGADFNDYLGVSWTYGDEGVDEPERNQFRCLDCSGFVRMVFGYRKHLTGYDYADRLPLSLAIRADNSAIPRRAFQIADGAPGVLIAADTGLQVTDFSRLEIGDLVFFDADPADGRQIDHVGIYLGIDSIGRHRFISSRKGANGPTLADYRGRSILDGSGLYAQSFRAIRRL